MTKPKVNRERQFWRMQVDEYPAKGEKMYGTRHQFYSHQKEADHAVEVRDRLDDPPPEHISVIPAEFDELVIDHWCHIEGMSKNDYWMSIAGLTINVTVGKDGYAKRATIELDERQEGCTYGGDYAD